MATCGCCLSTRQGWPFWSSVCLVTRVLPWGHLCASASVHVCNTCCSTTCMNIVCPHAGSRPVAGVTSCFVDHNLRQDYITDASRVRVLTQWNALPSLAYPVCKDTHCFCVVYLDEPTRADLPAGQSTKGRVQPRVSEVCGVCRPTCRRPRCFAILIHACVQLPVPRILQDPEVMSRDTCRETQ